MQVILRVNNTLINLFRKYKTSNFAAENMNYAIII